MDIKSLNEMSWKTLYHTMLIPSFCVRGQGTLVASPRNLSKVNAMAVKNRIRASIVQRLQHQP